MEYTLNNPLILTRHGNTNYAKHHLDQNIEHRYHVPCNYKNMRENKKKSRRNPKMKSKIQPSKSWFYVNSLTKPIWNNLQEKTRCFHKLQ